MMRGNALIADTLLAAALVVGILLAGSACAQDTSESTPPETRVVVPQPAVTPPITATPASSPAMLAASPVVSEMALPKIMAASVDWKAARDALAQLRAAPQTPAATDADGDLLTRLNAAASATYNDIAKSAVPVLLPVDTDALLRKADTPPAAAIFKLNFFLAGPAGYDAAFTLGGAASGEMQEFGRKEDAVVLISGFAMLYNLDPPVAAPAAAAKELVAQYPGIRRRFLENYVRYSFEKFGVPYTASMLCFDGRAHMRWVTCREADAILQQFVKTLQFAGGMPQQIASAPPNTIDRPAPISPEFTFASPGRLIQNTGFKGFDGKADWTVYAKIRFPLNAPAYANSQSFLNWGNCDFTGRTPNRQVKGAIYRCKVNDKLLAFDESAIENRSYPWRDNFCEHRRFFVGQCPGGEGHQGQDIRPATCQLRNEGADRCNPLKDDVLAVRDGTILRVPRHESLYLLVNAPGEHVRFRYLHMYPDMLDADGLVSGREVKEGQVIGKVGNFDRVPHGTTYHLHFEMQVPTHDGWVFVSPYATLISAYERLIGGRGQELAEPEIVRAPQPDTSVSAVPVKPKQSAALERARDAERPSNKKISGQKTPNIARQEHGARHSREAKMHGSVVSARRTKRAITTSESTLQRARSNLRFLPAPTQFTNRML